MRQPCKFGCDTDTGRLVPVNGQNVVRCAVCNRAQYNAPKTETGEKTRSVTTVHNGVKPKQRTRIINRAGGACEKCHAREHLQVGHIVSVDVGLRVGLDESLLNDDENLIAECEECNSGQGNEPMSLRLAVAILKARKSWAEANR
jgi:5-methylcytosine-specific restriction endonuclease McrA